MGVMTNLLQQFRDEVYQNFNNFKRTDTLMDLVDALSNNTTARSVVELTMNPQFHRTYRALNKAIAVDSLSDKLMARLVAKTTRSPQERKFYLIGLDVTSDP